MNNKRNHQRGVWVDEYEEEFMFSASPIVSQSLVIKREEEPPMPLHIDIKTPAQQKYFNLLKEKSVSILAAVGPAGSGKTHLGLHAGIWALKNGRVKKLIITRPAVSADEDIGFLPGTLEEKMDPFLRPIFDILHKYFTVKEVRKLMEELVIEVSPLAYMRGRTFTDAWIVADEMQNATPSQLFMITTRLGENAKLVLTGDTMQVDRKFSGSNCGLADFIRRYEQKLELTGKIPEGVRVFRFSNQDVVRSQVVKTVLDLYEDLGQK